MMTHSVLLATIIPGIAGVIMYIARKYVKRNAGWLATVVTAISFILLAGMGLELFTSHQYGVSSLTFSYSWVPQFNIDFGFIIDMVNLPIALVAALVTTLACSYSIKYMKERKGQPGYYANLLIFLTGLIGVFLSANLIQFYLFWEIMLIPSYLLVAFWGTSEKKLEIGFKYFILTHIGAIAMLLGILLIYMHTGTFSLIELSVRSSVIPSSLIMPTFILFMIGFFVKMAVFPLHIWLPDTHAEAPTPISAMLSGIMIKCGAYGMARILVPLFSQTMIDTSGYLMIIGVITILYGGLMALVQTDIKRLLAYSSISQMGYIVLGIGSSNTLGIMGGLFHILNHSFCKSLLFMCAGLIIHQTGTRDMRKMGGLINKMPITSITCIIGALSLIGIPVLNSFWSEWLILEGGIHSGNMLVGVVGVVSTLITAGYYMWFIWRVFLGKTPKRLENVKDPDSVLYTPLIILAVAIIAIGVFPSLALAFVTPAAEYLANFLP